MNKLIQETLNCIQNAGDVICCRQMYCFPGFDYETDDPHVFFRKRGVKFDGELYVEFPASTLFSPIPQDDLLAEAETLGLTLPADYVEILSTFGSFNPPGDDIWNSFSRPTAAAGYATIYGYPETPISALAIADFNDVSDGNAIGYICDQGKVDPTLYRFDHGFGFDPANPDKSRQPIADSLAEFLLRYIGEGE